MPSASLLPKRAAPSPMPQSLSPKKDSYVEPFRLIGLDRALELWWFFFGPVIANLLQPGVTGNEAQTSPMLLEYLSRATTPEPHLSRSIPESLLRTAIFSAPKFSARCGRCPSCSRLSLRIPPFVTAKEITRPAPAIATPCAFPNG